MKKNSENRLYLDPRTKILLVLYCGTILTIRHSFIVEMTYFAIIFLISLFVHKKKTSLEFLVAYILVGAIPFICIPYVTGATNILFQTLSTIMFMFTPAVFSLNILTKTTTVSDSISALRKIKLPDTIVIPVAVLFRFIPTLKEEWQSIRRAMKLRGIGISVIGVIKNPLANLEYVLIPLMTSTANISEELAAASMSRGLAKGVKRVPVFEVKLSWIDYFIMIMFPLIVVLVSFLLNRGIAL